MNSGGCGNAWYIYQSDCSFSVVESCHLSVSHLEFSPVIVTKGNTIRFYLERSSIRFTTRYMHIVFQVLLVAISKFLYGTKFMVLKKMRWGCPISLTLLFSSWFRASMTCKEVPLRLGINCDLKNHPLHNCNMKDVFHYKLTL